MGSSQDVWQSRFYESTCLFIEGSNSAKHAQTMHFSVNLGHVRGHPLFSLFLNFFLLFLIFCFPLSCHKWCPFAGQNYATSLLLKMLWKFLRWQKPYLRFQNVVFSFQFPLMSSLSQVFFFYRLFRSTESKLCQLRGRRRNGVGDWKERKKGEGRVGNSQNT